MKNHSSAPQSASLKQTCFRPFHLLVKAMLVAMVVASPGTVFAQVTQVLIKSGDPSPDGSGVAREFGMAALPIINNNGQVAFVGALAEDLFGSPEWSVFTGEAGTTVPLTVFARQGTPAPDGNGTFIGPAGNPGINDNGVIIIKSDFQGAVGGGKRVYTTQGGLTEIVRSNDPAPGGNGFFEGFDYVLPTGSIIPVNASGQTTFRATLTGTAMGTLDDVGIFRSDGGTLTEVARKGTAYPGIGTFGLLRDPVINDAGQVLFGATVLSDGGFYLGDGATVLKIAHPGDPSPDGMGTFYSSFAGQGALNNNGTAAVVFNMTGGGRFGPDMAIVLSDGVTSTVVARTENPDPLGNIWRGLGNSLVGAYPAPPSMNDGGELAFGGTTSPTLNGAKTSHVYAGLPGALTIVVSGGDPAPDGNGNFPLAGGFGPPLINANGDVVFTANLENTTTGEENRGLFLWDSSAGVLHQVARQGDMLAGDKIFDIQISAWPQAGRSGSGFNDLGQIAFQFTLLHSETGIAVFGPPVAIRGTTFGSGIFSISWATFPSGGAVDIYRTTDLVTWTQVSAGNTGTTFFDTAPPRAGAYYSIVPAGSVFP